MPPVPSIKFPREFELWPNGENKGSHRERRPGRPSTQYQVPPGIRTLAQWGEQRIPSGKKAGKTFNEVFMENDGYMMQVKNRKAVSPWLRSFQNYLTARWKHRALQQLPVTPMQSQGVPSDGSKMTKPSQSSRAPDHDWEKVGYPSTSHKRAIPEIEKGTSSSTSMTTEPNQDKIEKLQTQIAILQRELARETRVPEDQ
eukprot:s3236_g6.t1